MHISIKEKWKTFKIDFKRIVWKKDEKFHQQKYTSKTWERKETFYDKNIFKSIQ